MLANETRKVTKTAESKIEIEENGVKKSVTIEVYSASIESENPEDIRFSRIIQGGMAGRKLYKENREQCRADYAAFEDEVYKLQDEMIAENQKEAKTES